MAFTNITITATEERPDGTPAQGSVTVTLSERITNSGVSVDPTPITGTLNTSGQLVNSSGHPFVVVANDDTGTTPAGSFYSFVVEFDNAPLDQFDAVVSHTAGGGTVDLSALWPSVP